MVDFPNAPTNGQIHEENGSKWVWNDPPAAWSIVVEAPESNSASTTGPTLPSSPNEGDIHYLTVEPVGLYVWYNDGDSSQWVQTNGSSVVEPQVILPERQWVDVTSERVAGTIYQNDTDIEMQVAVTGMLQVNERFKIGPTSDNLTPIQTAGISSSARTAVYCEIPAGWFYLLDAAAGFIYWNELRGVKSFTSIPAPVQEFHDPAGAASWRIVGTTLECWGVAPQSTSDVTINFPKTFNSAPIFNGNGVFRSGVVHAPVISIKTISATSVTFGIFRSNDVAASTTEVYWRAVGKWDGVS